MFEDKEHIYFSFMLEKTKLHIQKPYYTETVIWKYSNQLQALMLIIITIERKYSNVICTMNMPQNKLHCVTCF